MASLIVFGFVALIVIVFLLSFNIKAISKPEKKDLSEKKDLKEAAPRELAENKTTVIQQELLEKPNNQLLRMSDDQYRKALRQIDTRQGQKSTITSQNRLNDNAYRTAVRANYKKTK